MLQTASVCLLSFTSYKFDVTTNSAIMLLPASVCLICRWIPIFDVNDCQRTCMLLLTACVCLVSLNACLRRYE